MAEVWHRGDRRNWRPRPAVYAVLVYALLVLWLYHQTLWSTLAIWLRSDTFAHGFLILPISLWLVWQQREQLLRFDANPDLRVLLLTIPVGAAWLLARLADVLVVQQLAMVAMLILGCWALLGHHLGRLLAFPLCFLFLAVPVGESLIAPMMEFTAASTIWLIRLTGIPVYREGLFFSLPSGSWSVVEACSGVRYIIASVTLGVLYAYLTYRSFWRRLCFILVSFILPILANTIRAYIIVMLGHLSDMRIATGVDHLIYGWIFFGLVVMLMFWAGSFFREDGGDRSSVGAVPLPASAGVARGNGLALAGVAACLSAAVWPAIAAMMDTGPRVPADPGRLLPVAPGWQQLEIPVDAWRPESGVQGEVGAAYRQGGHQVHLYIQYDSGSLPGEEVVGSIECLVTRDMPWRVISRTSRSIATGQAELPVREFVLRRGDQFLLVWSWYRVGATDTRNDYRAKISEVLSQLGLVPYGAYRMVLVSPHRDETDADNAGMQSFLRDSLSGLRETLDRAGESDQP